MVSSPQTYNSAEFQQFLDTSQYSVKGIQKYEFIFGNGFISSGGIDTTLTLCEKYLDGKIPEGARILDVGCGIGGGCKFLSDRYKASVIGIDLSLNVLKIAQDRYKDNPLLTFSCQDALLADYPKESFDLIYSRDTILHVSDKLKLYRLFYKWLKPGGSLLVTDYGCGPANIQTDEFKAYVAQRGYTLLTDDQYQALVREAGFSNATAVNLTNWFREILQKEKNRALESKRREQFLQQYSEEELQSLVEGWDKKLERTAQGSQTWTLIVAQK